MRIEKRQRVEERVRRSETGQSVQYHICEFFDDDDHLMSSISI